MGALKKFSTIDGYSILSAGNIDMLKPVRITMYENNLVSNLSAQSIIYSGDFNLYQISVFVNGVRKKILSSYQDIDAFYIDGNTIKNCRQLNIGDWVLLESLALSMEV